VGYKNGLSNCGKKGCAKKCDVQPVLLSKSII
jgi:hypothetical protein